MYRASTLKIIMLLSMFTLTQTTTPFATEIDHRKMRRDLDIAEEALKRIVQYHPPNVKSPTWLETNQIRSAYIKDYGIVFVANASTAGKIFQIGDKVKINVKRSDFEKNKNAQTDDHVEVRMNKVKNAASKHIKASDIPFSEEGKKSRLTEFLQTYASTIGQLKDSDHITVILDSQIKVFHGTVLFSEKADPLGNKTSSLLHKVEEYIHLKNDSTRAHTQTDTISFTNTDTLTFNTPHVKLRIVPPDSIGTPDPMHFSIKNQKKANPRSILQASIRKSDLNKYQKGGLSNEKFSAKINFHTLTGDTTLIKKIDIFSGIIDKSLGPNQESPLNINNKTLGTYICNLGAFFFTTNNPETQLHINNPFKVKDTLIETLADYGATLRDLKPNEEVIVHFHSEYPQYASGGPFGGVRVIKTPSGTKTTRYDYTLPNEFPENLFLRVQKKHLINYTTGKINLEQLRDKIIVTDY